MLKDLAAGVKQLKGVCVYHLALNLPPQPNSRHTDIFHCDGQMAGTGTHYYQIYRKTLRATSSVCFSCWTPTFEPSFNHPLPKEKENWLDICRGRAHYEDIFRGIPYIIWRTRELQDVIFNWFGSPSLSGKFNSVVDWCAWLSRKADFDHPNVTNMVAITWAFVHLHQQMKLPQAPLRFTGK